MNPGMPFRLGAQVRQQMRKSAFADVPSPSNPTPQGPISVAPTSAPHHCGQPLHRDCPPPAPPRRRSSLRRRVCLLLLGVVAALLVLETAVRALVPVSDFFWEWDPLLGTKLTANKRGRWVVRGLLDTQVVTNSHGFRDRERAYEKPPQRQRVVLLGDSFLEALQVPFEHSLPYLLEEALRQRGFDVEVLNLGISGYGTAREYLLLREKGLRYQPDLVVLFFTGNDVSDNSASLQGLPHVPYPIRNGRGQLLRDPHGEPLFTTPSDAPNRLGPLASLLRRHAKSYRLLREAVDAWPGLHAFLYRTRLVSTPPEPVNQVRPDNLGYYELYRVEDRGPWADAWSVTFSFILELRRLATRHGARFGVVVIPFAWEVYPQWRQSLLRRLPASEGLSLDFDRPARRLGSFLAASRIPHRVLLEDFRTAASHRAHLYLPGDGHWSAAGHQLATELITDTVATWLARSIVQTSKHDRAATPQYAEPPFSPSPPR